MIAPKFKWWLNVDIDYLKAFFPRLKCVEIKQIACDKITVFWAPVEEHTRGGVRRSAMIEERRPEICEYMGVLGFNSRSLCSSSYMYVSFRLPTLWYRLPKLPIIWFLLRILVTVPKGKQSKVKKESTTVFDVSTKRNISRFESINNFKVNLVEEDAIFSLIIC